MKTGYQLKVRINNLLRTTISTMKSENEIRVSTCKIREKKVRRRIISKIVLDTSQTVKKIHINSYKHSLDKIRTDVYNIL